MRGVAITTSDNCRQACGARALFQEVELGGDVNDTITMDSLEPTIKKTYAMHGVVNACASLATIGCVFYKGAVL